MTAIVGEILRRRGELALTPEQEPELEKATADVKRELKKTEPKNSAGSGGLNVIREIAVKTLSSRAEKTMTGNWPWILGNSSSFFTHFDLEAFPRT